MRRSSRRILWTQERFQYPVFQTEITLVLTAIASAGRSVMKRRSICTETEKVLCVIGFAASNYRLWVVHVVFARNDREAEHRTWPVAAHDHQKNRQVIQQSHFSAEFVFLSPL